MEQSIDFHVTGAVATITLNRPDKMNSFNGAMHAQLRAALDKVEHDSRIRALVLTGAGRGFCAGQDLSDEAVCLSDDAPPPDLGAVVEREYKPLVLRLHHARVPTIAAVNGIAAGAGVSLALACDLVIAKASAVFVQAFAKVGLIPDTGGTWFLPQRVGMARAMGLAMLADKLSAAEAERIGLIWRCADDDAFAGETDALAQRLAAAPTVALVRIRQAMHASLSHTLAQQLTLEGDIMRELGWRHDYAEGVRAFAEKRAPTFIGA